MNKSSIEQINEMDNKNISLNEEPAEQSDDKLETVSGGVCIRGYNGRRRSKTFTDGTNSGQLLPGGPLNKPIKEDVSGLSSLLNVDGTFEMSEKI